MDKKTIAAAFNATAGSLRLLAGDCEDCSTKINLLAKDCEEFSAMLHKEAGDDARDSRGRFRSLKDGNGTAIRNFIPLNGPSPVSTPGAQDTGSGKNEPDGDSGEELACSQSGGCVAVADAGGPLPASAPDVPTGRKKRGTPRSKKTQELFNLYASTNLSIEQLAPLVGYQTNSGSPKVLIHQGRKSGDPKVLEGDKRRGVAPSKPSAPRLTITKGKILTIDRTASTVHGVFGHVEVPRSMLRILDRMANGHTYHIQLLALDVTPRGTEAARDLINDWADRLGEIGIEFVKVGSNMYRVRTCDPYSRD